ncbi:unnamed protein product [Meloidogyne enterolobii]|uniref:Uncharacterized protein n=2 Tax=Meloidogyne enterolobii TaxID=390850 RepID=A0ACB1AF70_MELEN
MEYEMSKENSSLSKCLCFKRGLHYFEAFLPSKKPKEPSSSNKEDCINRLINLIINCKVFIRDLNYDGEEGSLIDIFSFMEKDEKLEGTLKKIFELSKIQSKKLDKAINEKIYREHLENKAMEYEERKECKNAIVEGAGPVGLYATFKLFIGKSLLF